MSCDWPVDRTLLPDLPAADDPGYAAAAAQRGGAEDLAVSIMWALSGRQFGVCPYTARPCAPLGVCLYPVTDSFGVPMVVWDSSVAAWRNLWCGCGGGCRLSGPGAVHLPGPVVEVTDVFINGVRLDLDQYAVEGDVLFRRGGAVAWPPQDLSRPLGEPGTWSVEYRRGVPVPSGVDRLTGLLAKEILAATTGDTKCRLPRNVTRVNRQGVSYEVFNPNSIYDSGKTGLPEVDMWLASVNPAKLPAAPSVV